jgi:hypothetical protein
MGIVEVDETYVGGKAISLIFKAHKTPTTQQDWRLKPS